jgi:hypothetical protein
MAAQSAPGEQAQSLTATPARWSERRAQDAATHQEECFMDMRQRIREQAQLASTYAADGGYLSAARILRGLAAEVTRHALADHAGAPMNLLQLPGSIAMLVNYAAQAPAIKCDEGYWDDGSDSANWDGMNQAKSEAAALIRAALDTLGIDPPRGVEVCPECYRDGSDGHSYQCGIGQAEAEGEGDDDDA